MDEIAHFQRNNPVLSDYNARMLIFSAYVLALLLDLLLDYGRDRQFLALRLVSELISSTDIPLISAADSATKETYAGSFLCPRCGCGVR